MNKKLRLRAFALTLLTGGFALVVGLGTNAIAQDGQTEPGSGLSVFPTRFERTIEPGASGTIQATVKNVTSAGIVAVPVINDFESDDDTGTPRIIFEDKNDTPSIKPFFGELGSFPIPPGEAVTIEFDISLPADTPAGGYYGVLRFVATPEGSEGTDTGQVALTASIAVPVLIEVPGEVTEQIQLRNILFYRNNIAGTFFTVKPEQLGVQIINQGNGFSKPFGTVTVTNPLGDEIMNYELNNSNPRSNVLPDSTRSFRSDLEGVKIPGRYTATADVSFGNGGEVLRMSKAFWYLPYWFVGLLIVVLSLLTYVGYLVYRRIKTGSFKRR